MRVLGIDPGSNLTGYGILDEANPPRVIDWGVIRTGRGDLPSKLAKIFGQIEQLLTKYNPQAVAVEEIFHAKNTKSALVLGQARGAALTAIGLARIQVFEYPARRVKQTVSGSGSADKIQLCKVLRATLGQAPDQLDASDAVAIALCHLRWYKRPR